MEPINKLFDKLLTQLKVSHSPLPDLLKPGLEMEYLDSQITKEGIQLPEDVYSLYRWKNGTVASVDRDWSVAELFLFNLAIFITFEEALLLYRNGADKYWNRNLFPLFASGGGEIYLINCEAGNEFGMIYYYAPGDYRFNGTISIYDSLTNLLETIIDCYKEKIYHFEEGSYFLIIDDREEEQISASLNPASKYWKLEDGSGSE